MSDTLTRRAAMAGTLGALAATAVPVASDATPDKVPEGLEGLAASLQDLVAMEITGSRFEPRFRSKTIILVRMGTASAGQQVFVRRKSMPAMIARYVYEDSKTLYVRGLKH